MRDNVAEGGFGIASRLTGKEELPVNTANRHLLAAAFKLACDPGDETDALAFAHPKVCRCIALLPGCLTCKRERAQRRYERRVRP